MRERERERERENHTHIHTYTHRGESYSDTAPQHSFVRLHADAGNESIVALIAEYRKLYDELLAEEDVSVICVKCRICVPFV